VGKVARAPKQKNWNNEFLKKKEKKKENEGNKLQVKKNRRRRGEEGEPRS